MREHKRDSDAFTISWFACFSWWFPLRAFTVFFSLQMIFGICFSAFVVQSRVKGEQWPHDGAVDTFEIPRAFRGAENYSVISFLLIMKKKFHLKGYREEKPLLHQPTHMFVCLVSPPRRQQTGIQGSVLSFSSVFALLVWMSWTQYLLECSNL